MSPAVRTSWLAYTEPLEGRVRTLYRDVRGLCTTAYGLLCDSPGAAQTLAWRQLDGTLATPWEVAAEWARVHALPASRLPGYYAVGRYLLLDDVELARVTLTRLDADVAVLEERWPQLASWSPFAQAALLSLAWAVGAGAGGSGLTGPTWPHLQAAAAAQDWIGAASAGQLRWQDNPGVRPRDYTVRALFLLASGASLAEACASWPPGSSADAARRALRPLVEAIDAELAESAPTLETGAT